MMDKDNTGVAAQNAASTKSKTKSLGVTTLDAPIKSRVDKVDKKEAAASTKVAATTVAPKTIYRNVILDGEDGPGMLVLTSSGLVYHPGSEGGRRVQIAWSSVAKHLLNGADRPKALVKVVHKQGNSYTFQMNDKSDQIQVKQDIDRRLKVHHEQLGLSPSAGQEPANLAGAHDSFTSNTDPSTFHDSMTSFGSHGEEMKLRGFAKRPGSPRKTPPTIRSVTDSALPPAKSPKRRSQKSMGSGNNTVRSFTADATSGSTPLRASTGSRPMVVPAQPEGAMDGSGSPVGRASSDGYYLYGGPLPGAYYDNSPPVCAPPLSSQPIATTADVENDGDSSNNNSAEAALAMDAPLVSATLVTEESKKILAPAPAAKAAPIRMEHELQDPESGGARRSSNTDGEKIAGDREKSIVQDRGFQWLCCGAMCFFLFLVIIVVVVVAVLLTRGKDSSNQTPAPAQAEATAPFTTEAPDSVTSVAPVAATVAAPFTSPPTPAPGSPVAQQPSTPTEDSSSLATQSPETSTSNPREVGCFNTMILEGFFTYQSGSRFTTPLASNYFSPYDVQTMAVIEQFLESEVQADFLYLNPVVVTEFVGSLTRSNPCTDVYTTGCNYVNDYVGFYDFNFVAGIAFGDCGPDISLFQETVNAYDYGGLVYLTNNILSPDTPNDWEWFPFNVIWHQINSYYSEE